MREILAALIDDTSRQLQLLEAAVRNQDARQCMRLAHYSKGACANVGANTAAVLLDKIERQAAGGSVENGVERLAALATEVERLRAETI